VTTVWRWSGDGVVALHFAYLAYLLVGGFVAWRWPKTIVPHALAALWAAHPLLVESVVWLTDLKRLLASAAVLAGALLWEDVLERGRARDAILAVVALAVGLASHPLALALAAFVLLRTIVADAPALRARGARGGLAAMALLVALYVPLGVLLSGGIDSSVVTALAVRASSETVKTFSISFAESSFDESQYARAVAKFLGTDHHEERFNASLAANLVSEIGAWMDEPISDPSVVPTYLLSRFTRKHVTVALGGDGGDEIFAGYPMYFGHHMARAYLSLPKFLRRGLVEPLVNLLPVKTKNLSFDYRARRFITASHYDDVARHHVWFGSFTPDDTEQLLTEDVKHVSESDIYRDARRLFAECDSNNMTECMQSLDTQFYLAEDILTKVDRSSMAVSLEVRAPYIDPRVAEFAASLPASYKLHGYTSKYILKKAAKGLVPPFVWRRGKKGFGVPFAKWLKSELRPLAHDLLSPERLGRSGIFNPAYVAKLQDEHERGVANHRKLLWTLLSFELWRESFVETPKRIETSVTAS